MRAKLFEPMHISWHIAWLSVGVLTGIALAMILPASTYRPTVWGISAAVLFGITVSKRWKLLIVCALISGMLLGAWRSMHERQGLAAYRPYVGQVVLLKGKVSEDATLGPQGDIRVTLDQIHMMHAARPGTVWASIMQKPSIKRGDMLYVEGKLSSGFGSLAAGMYNAHVIRVEHPHPGDIARQLRDWFADGIRKDIPDPEAALGIGYLTGQHSALPGELNSQLRTVGLTHAVVASGYNLTILVALGRRLLARRSKYLATVTAGLLIVGFMAITGLSPSMNRAGLVSGLSLLAWYYGRKIHPLVLLPFAAAVTALFSPAYIWGDVGWYLSFAAFAGVLVVGPLFERYFWGEREHPNAVQAMFIETISAEIVTAPIIILAFGQYAAYALIANVMVVPLIPVTMLLTFGAGLAGVSVPMAARWIGWPAHIVLHYMVWVVVHIANLPEAQREVHMSAPVVVIYYVLLILGLIWLHRRVGYVTLDTKNQKVLDE